MADQLDEEISNEIKRIAGGDKPPVVLSGKVDSVDLANNIINVILTGDGDSVPVLNNLFEGCLSGFYMVPKAGADCEVAELDGPGKWTMIRASGYDKVVMQAGTLIQMNDGSNKGLLILDKVVAKMNVLEKDLNALKQVFTTGWVPVPNDGGAALKTAAATWAGSNITLTKGDDLENKKVTHG